MKIEKTKYSYQVAECDLKFGKRITLDGELLVSASVLDKIRAEIDELAVLKFSSGERIYKDEVLDIIDRYITESEE